MPKVATKSRLVPDNEPSAKPKLSVRVEVNTHVCDNNPQGTIKRVWDNYQTIGEIPKTSHKKLEVAAACRDGVKYIYIREWFLNRTTKEWWPNNKKSITVPILYPLLDENNKIVDTLVPFADLADMMFEAAEVLEDMWLYDDEHAVFVEKKKKGPRTNGKTED